MGATEETHRGDPVGWGLNSRGTVLYLEGGQEGEVCWDPPAETR